ncbi:hypothetical protein A1Q1_03839 [Trichosporon asahii var. asahii CBS 2479]|uniref:Uncharacterized protein n=1 Tax=Trichosporon asahii var. asahii (strain ATCC 90039 / CBS 2479 / JCM 2466 / KCTC 7840 / NBRC 103889/ NCYC 2677 / UAMH 7654) TaxID=1186058 RepID=J5QHE4_TRIAS|nr:hypothetical protein A1Q1_03839 [Trichosporon asahii var. asahii CBS 2479]EJT47368.1 hypothetical protein A1Q1_03839 [Trichosporon asahii var. asahii CBS 2479]
MLMTLQLRLHPTFVRRAAEAQCAIFTATGVQVSLDDNDVAWPAAATRSDWTMYQWDIGEFYGTVTIEIDEIDARCILALYVNLHCGGPLVDVFTPHPGSPSETPFRVCVVTSDECAPGRRERRKRWERHVPTPRQLYDELGRWATPLKVHLGRYRVEVDIQSDDSTFSDPDWDVNSADDYVYGWNASVVFQSEAEYWIARLGSGGRICGWKVLWKKRLNDDSEIEFDLDVDSENARGLTEVHGLESLEGEPETPSPDISNSTLADELHLLRLDRSSPKGSDDELEAADVIVSAPDREG